MKPTDAAYHESGHGLVAYALKVPIRLLSIRPGEGESGRTRLDPSAVGDDMSGAMILVAGELAERRALGHADKFNWFADSHDASHARDCADHIAADGGCEGDVLEVRRFIELKTKSMLFSRWEAVEEIAATLQRHTTVLGEEVERICLAERARMNARAIAAKPPVKPRPDRQPKKKPRRPSSGDREVRPFTFKAVVKKGDG